MTSTEESSRTATAGAATSGPPADGSRSTRVASIDLIRGAVMILMAIDHVRVYSGVPAGGPTPGVFFTRWILPAPRPSSSRGRAPSSTAAARRSSRFRSAARGSSFQLTVIRIGWTLNLDFAHHPLAGVIWVIGWSILMAGS
jgi:hypothetical protein